MNLTTAVFLVNRDVRAIRVNYEPHESKQTMFKTLDNKIKKDDFVIIPTGTRHGFTVGKVTEIDVTPDFDDATKVDWVVQRLDKEEYETILKQEAEAVDAIRKAEFNRRKTQLFDSMVSAEEAGMIKALPIYKNGTPPINPRSVPKTTQFTDDDD